MKPPEGYPWHVVGAGGQARSAFVNGSWIVPLFKSLDECRKWWDKYCKQTNEQSPWGITEVWR